MFACRRCDGLIETPPRVKDRNEREILTKYWDELHNGRTDNSILCQSRCPLTDGASPLNIIAMQKRKVEDKYVRRAGKACVTFWKNWCSSAYFWHRHGVCFGAGSPDIDKQLSRFSIYGGTSPSGLGMG